MRSINVLLSSVGFFGQLLRRRGLAGERGFGELSLCWSVRHHDSDSDKSSKASFGT